MKAEFTIIYSLRHIWNRCRTSTEPLSTSVVCGWTIGQSSAMAWRQRAQHRWGRVEVEESISWLRDNQSLLWGRRKVRPTCLCNCAGHWYLTFIRLENQLFSDAIQLKLFFFFRNIKICDFDLSVVAWFNIAAGLNGCSHPSLQQ